MERTDPTIIFDRVAELRTATFELLDELVPAVRDDYCDLDAASAMVQLQGVANDLGRIERTLRRSVERAA